MSRKCQKNVYRHGSWRGSPCDKPAVTAAGYCRTHDPDLREQRRRKRESTNGPPVHKRRRLLREQLEAFVWERMPAAESKYVLKLVWFLTDGSPPWPLPEPPTREKEDAQA